MIPRRQITIVVEGILVAVHLVGQGEPVLCLTAIAHDAHDFDAMAQRVGERFQLVVVEWPGHGLSAPDTQPPSAARYAFILEDVVAQLGVKAPLIVGTIGGAAAILFASRNPVRGLVLCNSGGLVEVTAMVAKFCGWFEKFFAAGERGAIWFGPAFALYYRLVLKTQAAATQRRRIVRAGRRHAPLLRLAWAGFGRPEADLRRVAEGLDTPIWVAWARQDKIIPLKMCLPAILRLKRHTLTEFDAGHTPFLEQPDEFSRGFEKFVASLAPHISSTVH
jgi:pimeloyl-ACP methyl ester carboxylesterase